MVLPASRLFPNEVIVPPEIGKTPFVFSSIVVCETRMLPAELRPWVLCVASEFSTSSCAPGLAWKPKLELPAPADSAAAPSTKGATALPEAAPTPWFANGLGYATLAATALCGAGSGVAGTFALDDDHAANALVQSDPDRATRRNKAIAEAITADSLGAVAAGAFVATIVVFATRTGLD